jgi:hypothetical protein
MLIKKFCKFLFSFSLIFISLTLAASYCFASPSAGELLQRKGFVWKAAFTAHLRLHFEPSTFAETRIEDLKRWQEKAYIRNLQLLKVSNYSSQTDIFIVASRERMKQLIGDETNGVAFPNTKVVCFIFNEKIKAAGSHELMHVMAGNAWGVKFKSWINEGLATYADDNWNGYKLHDLNKYLLQEKKLIPLEKLIEDFSDYSAMITYPQAGSFVKYLYEQYGVEKVKDLWNSGTVKDLKRVLGKDIATLEKEWHSKLMEADATKVKYDFSPKK